MPNWCCNRLMFSGIQNNDALKTWIAGGQPSLHRRARKEGIQLFLAGCAGILRPLTEQCYPPYPQLVAHGMAADNRPSVQAYSDWLAMFMAGTVLDVETCQKLHQCWQNSHICHARWATLSEPEQQVIRQLYQQKSFDLGGQLPACAGGGVVGRSVRRGEHHTCCRTDGFPRRAADASGY